MEYLPASMNPSLIRLQTPFCSSNVLHQPLQIKEECMQAEKTAIAGNICKMMPLYLEWGDFSDRQMEEMADGCSATISLWGNSESKNMLDFTTQLLDLNYHDKPCPYPNCKIETVNVTTRW